MFRIGGSANEGITSGLAPRQGYANGLSEELRKKRMSEILTGETTLGEAQDLSRSLAYQPRGVTPADALIEFGLDIASRPPEGSIFSTAAASAKEPFQRYSKSKAESEAAKYVSESDMFKTLIQAGATAAGEEGLAGKTEQWKMEQIPGLVDSISQISAIAKEDRTQEQKNQLESDRIKLGRLEKEDPFVAWFLSQEKIGLGLFKDIKGKLIIKDTQSKTSKYDPALGEDDPQLIIDAYIEFRKQVKRMGKAEGGRIGYQNAGPVMGQGMPTQMPTTEDAMPEELGDISYEELRARLPQEVSDEVVRLLANSAEALEDFATIQTEQDISNFNKKYGVNLVLPAEG
jgi:hypothetical protein